MKKAPTNSYSHVKIVMAGLLTTNSLVRTAAEVIYNANYGSNKEKQKAVMAYLHSLGVPNGLGYSDFASLLFTVFPAVKDAAGKSPFPIDIQYDQDNCEYGALIDGAVSLDEDEAAEL
jgi:hypothetical protein